MFYTQLKQLVKNNSFFSRISEDPEISNLKINGYIVSLTHFSCGITAGLLASLVSKSLLDNAPNYLVGCIIQKRKLSKFDAKIDSNLDLKRKLSLFVYFFRLPIQPMS